MSALLLCDEPDPITCPPRFRLRSPGWIDIDNFSQPKASQGPAAGVRLRWTLPFLTPKAVDRMGRPTRYIVERAGPIRFDNMKELKPDVGHKPRAITPPSLWSPFTRLDPLTFSRSGGACNCVDAVTFQLPPGVGPVIVSLVDVSGVARFSGEVEGGEIFYFEMSDLKSVLFSEDVGQTTVSGLNLYSKIFDQDFQTIAEIDADAWHSREFSEVLERVARADGTPFGSMTDEDWLNLRNLGEVIDSGFGTGDDVDEAAISTLRLTTELQFEAAALVGCGFVDGEHPVSGTLDKIDHGQMMSAPNGDLYVYRVTAELVPLAGPSTKMRTNLCFVLSRHAPMLGAPNCHPVKLPLARSEFVTPVQTESWEDIPQRAGAAVKRIDCEGSWELVSKLPWDEVVFLSPSASDSVVTGEKFQGGEPFLNGLNRGPRTIRGTKLVEVRELRFEIPFFDCEVGVEAQVQDYWDRRGVVAPAHLVPPEIEYRGQALPLASGTAFFDEVVSQSKAVLAFDQSLTWQADRLAVAAQAHLKTLMRHPTLAVAEASVEIGPASPAGDGDWQADLFTQAKTEDLAIFVGGFLTVDAFSALVRAIGPVTLGRARIIFETLSECGGATLYHCPGTKTSATLGEDPRSERLWLALDRAIPIEPSGAPAKYSLDVDLPALDASRTLSFSSRLEFTFRGRDYRTQLSVPAMSPYLHPPPKAPATCIEIGQLGTDFYGRSMLRVVAGCPDLDKRFAVQVEAAPGDLTAPEAYSEYLDKRQVGLFEAQRCFEGDVIFESYALLESIAENDPFTIGLSYVREEDQRESPPKLDRSWRKRIE